MVVSILLITIIFAGYFFLYYMEESIKDKNGTLVMNMAKTISHMTVVQDNLGKNNGSDKIQNSMEKLRLNTKVQFITVIDMYGIRYSHPLPEKIGGRFEGGDEEKVLENGESYLSEGVGTLGHSLRAFVPVYQDGVQVGAVVAGVLIGDVKEEYKNSAYKFMPYLILSIVLALIGATLISNNIKKTIYGLEPKEIAFILSEREAILEGIEDGLIAVNDKNQLILINKTAKNLLKINENNNMEQISDYKYFSGLKYVLESDEALLKCEVNINSTVLMVNYYPLRDNNGLLIGAIASFQDMTKVKEMAEELTGIKKLLWSLRAQNHEFMNKLHTISGLIQLEEYDDALEFIHHTTEVRMKVINVLSKKIKVSSIAGLILAKYNKATEAKIDFQISEDSNIESLPINITSEDLIIVVGNLIENSIDAVIGATNGVIKLSIRQLSHRLEILVENNGNPISKEIIENFCKQGVSTKPGERGHGMYNTKRILDKAQGEITFTTGETTQWTITIPYI
jgi:two-component system, CitB family, sensor kinase